MSTREHDPCRHRARGSFRDKIGASGWLKRQTLAGELDSRLTTSNLLQQDLRLSSVPQVEPGPFPCLEPGAGQPPKVSGSQNCLTPETPFSTAFKLLDSSRELSARLRPQVSRLRLEAWFSSQILSLWGVALPAPMHAPSSAA